MNGATRAFWESLVKVLLRCWILGFGLLLIWLAASQLVWETICDLHGPLFGLSDHELAVIFYCGMGLLKLCVLIAFFIPWLAIRMVLRNVSA